MRVDGAWVFDIGFYIRKELAKRHDSRKSISATRKQNICAMARSHFHPTPVLCTSASPAPTQAQRACALLPKA